MAAVIYLELFTDPEGDTFFSIYQISWIKLKKVTFCKLKTSRGRNYVYNLQTFRGFCQVHFTILLQIQHENKFLPNQWTSRSQSSSLSWYLFVNCFIYRTNFVFRKCLETRHHLGSGCKTVNSQGYSELLELFKTSENCY